MAEAAAFPLDAPGADLPPAARQQAIQAALERIFEELNVDEPREQWARDYRTAGNRSLSVGDVVVVGDATAICSSSREEPVSSRGPLPAEALQWAQEMAQRCRARSAEPPGLSR